MKKAEFTLQQIVMIIIALVTLAILIGVIVYFKKGADSTANAVWLLFR